MKLRHLFFTAIAIAPAVALAACQGQILDVGATTRPASSPVFDGAVSDTGVPASIPTGLVVDGVACTSQVTSNQAVFWPAFSVSLDGVCGALGEVAIAVDTRADITYPQDCGRVTTVGLAVFADGEGGTSAYNADSFGGTCTVYAGPNAADQNAFIAFEAVAVRRDDPSRMHRLTYRGTGTVNDQLDSSLGPFVDTGAPAACHEQPSDARPIGVACPIRTRPAGDTQANPADECTSDTECTSIPEGRCTLIHSQITFGFEDHTEKRICTYDECTQDSECGQTAVCGCGVGTGGQNLCLAVSNCRVDGDCDDGQRCAFSQPFLLTPGHDAVLTGSEIVIRSVDPHTLFTEGLGYFCTTPQDACCVPDAGTSGTCDYNLDINQWGWGYAP